MVTLRLSENVIEKGRKERERERERERRMLKSCVIRIENLDCVLAKT